MKKKRFLEVLQNALDKDKTKTTVLGITKLGLLEMTRKKVRGAHWNNCINKMPLLSRDGKRFIRIYDHSKD